MLNQENTIDSKEENLETKVKSDTGTAYKNVHIRGISGLYFPTYGPNVEIFSVNTSNAGKCGPRKPTPNMDTVYAV